MSTPASRSPVYDYRDVLPFDFRFNPGRAAELSVVGRIADPAIDLVRAVILDREGISMAEHQLRCQQLYPGYDPVSNTYYGPDGVPQYCSL